MGIAFNDQLPYLISVCYELIKTKPFNAGMFVCVCVCVCVCVPRYAVTYLPFCITIVSITIISLGVIVTFIINIKY